MDDVLINSRHFLEQVYRGEESGRRRRSDGCNFNATTVYSIKESRSCSLWPWPGNKKRLLVVKEIIHNWITVLLFKEIEENIK